MKKVLLFASMAAVMASCSDDDSNNTSTSLNGTWKLTAFTSATPVDINKDGTASTNLIAESSCYGNTKIVFSGSNSAVVHWEGYIYDETTDELTCGMEAPEAGVYAQSGNNVVITAAGESITFAKSGNTITATQEDEEFGATTMVFTKQ